MRSTVHSARVALTGIVVSMAASACSGGNDGDAAGEPTATVTVTETVSADTSPSSTPSETTTTDASPVPQEPNVGNRALKVGQWREGTQVRTRVAEFYQPADAPKPSYLRGTDDGDGAVARVEMCTRKDADPTKAEIYDLFMAYDANGGQYTRSGSSWGEWPPLPQLPINISIAPGKCLSGWVLLTAPKNTKVVTVDMSDGEGGSIAEWKVG